MRFRSCGCCLLPAAGVIWFILSFTLTGCSGTISGNFIIICLTVLNNTDAALIVNGNGYLFPPLRFSFPLSETFDIGMERVRQDRLPHRSYIPYSCTHLSTASVPPYYTLGSSNDNKYQKEKKGQVRNCQKTQYTFSLMKNLLHSTGIL